MGTTGVRGHIKFGRIFGSGRLDYLYILEKEDYYDVIAFENRGAGGTKRNGEHPGRLKKHRDVSSTDQPLHSRWRLLL
jgi:hypothetical protein